MSEGLTATYYLEFLDTSRTLSDNVTEFFSWATMGTSRELPYVDRRQQRSLRGSILNLVPDEGRPAAGLVTYEFHADTFEPSNFSHLLSILLYSSIQGSTRQLRLLDIKLPDAFALSAPGPKFGAAGIRQLLHVRPGAPLPLFGVIFKPRQGLSPELVGQIAENAFLGGADYVIDDEAMLNPRSVDIASRVRAVAAVSAKASAVGKRPMYFVNLTAGSDQVKRWVDEIQGLDLGALRVGVMVNGMVQGFDTVAELSSSLADSPIVANTVTSGMSVLAPGFNVSEHIFVELSRLAGADGVYAVRHATQYSVDPSKVETLYRHLIGRGKPHKSAFPIYAGSISLDAILSSQLPESPDFMLQAGSTVCGYTQAGISFPTTIRVATEATVRALHAVYGDSVDPEQYREDLIRANLRRSKGLNLNALGVVV